MNLCAPSLTVYHEWDVSTNCQCIQSLRYIAFIMIWIIYVGSQQSLLYALCISFCIYCLPHFGLISAFNHCDHKWILIYITVSILTLETGASNIVFNSTNDTTLSNLCLHVVGSLEQVPCFATNNGSLQLPTLNTTPGSIEAIIVYGYTIFHHIIEPQHFDIIATSSSDEMHIHPSYDVLDLYQKKLLISISSSVNRTKTTVLTVSDVLNQTVKEIEVNIIAECEANQYKQYDAILSTFACVDCLHSLQDGICISCEGIDGIICESDRIKVKYGWWAVITNETSSSWKWEQVINKTSLEWASIINETSFVTFKCPAGYCCREYDGCYLDERDTLCAVNRDPSVPLCGSCLPGYTETLSNVGDCRKCDYKDFWLETALLYTVGGFILIVIIHSLSPPTKTLHTYALFIYFNQTLLCYYHAYALIVCVTLYIPQVQTVLDVMTLSFPTCLPPDTTAFEKLWWTLFIPIVLAVEFYLLWCLGYLSPLSTQRLEISGELLFRVIYFQAFYTTLRVVKGWLYFPTESFDLPVFIIVFYITMAVGIVTLGYWGLVPLTASLYRDDTAWIYITVFPIFLIIVAIIFVFGDHFSGALFLVCGYYIFSMFNPYIQMMNNYLFQIIIACLVGTLSIYFDTEFRPVLIDFLAFLAIFPFAVGCVLFVLDYGIFMCCCITQEGSLFKQRGIYQLRLWGFIVKELESIIGKDWRFGNKHNLKLAITLTKEIPRSTLIDVAQFEKRLRHYFKQLQEATKLFIVGRHFDHEDENPQIVLDLQYRTKRKDIDVIEATFAQILQENNDFMISDISGMLELPHDINIVRMEIKGSLESTNKKNYLYAKSLGQYQNEVNEIRYQLQHLEYLRNMPFKRYFKRELMLTIENVVLSDSLYNNNLKKVMQILSKHDLNGSKILSLGILGTKHLIEREMSELMTMETFNMVFDLIQDDMDEIELKNKGSAEIGYILCKYPLQNLLISVEVACHQMDLCRHCFCGKELDVVNPLGISNYENLFCYLCNKYILSGKMLSCKGGQNKIHPEGYLICNDCSMDTSEALICLEQNQIKAATGWGFTECYNIRQQILKNDSPKKEDILLSIKQAFAKRLDQTLALKLVKQMDRAFDLEELFLKTKYAQTITRFSEFVINAINESTNIDDNRTKLIFESAADGLISICETSAEKKEDLEKYGLDHDILDELDRHNDWICYNCNNHNFYQYVNGRVREDISVCTVCGITHIDGVVMAIRNSDTYIMVNNENIRINYRRDIEAKNATKTKKEIETWIDDILSADKYDLSCPNRTDNEICPDIEALLKVLMYYNRWLGAIRDKTIDGKVDINATVNADIKTYIDNDTFKETFIAAVEQIKKINDDNMQKLQLFMMDDERMNVRIFSDLSRKAFASIITENISTIKLISAAKLFTVVSNCLKTKAQSMECGQFVDDWDKNVIDKYYHHIIDIHIKKGNRTNIENVFRLFEKALHWNDNPSKECISIQRKAQRFAIMNNEFDDTEEETKQTDEEVIDLWYLKQQYIQSQLDAMHSYLAHTDFTEYLDTIMDNNNEENVDNDEEQKDVLIELQRIVSSRDKVAHSDEYKKFVSSVSDFSQKYGFGVDHSHLYLEPKFTSIKDELIRNKLYTMSISSYQSALIKAIKQHQIELESFNTLTCRYFKAEYNIIRNSAIGVRHIFSIILYTDYSKFCTKFRETYRKSRFDETEEEVTERHRELYWIARGLFEAIEFFGTPMTPKDIVYHGLNKQMHFDRFTAFFNQPVSTTTQQSVAQQFSDGVGVILKLKCGVKGNISLLPKYLDVSTWSQYSNEEEKLFYGSSIALKIIDIQNYEHCKLISHKTELEILNRFQQMMKNKLIEWKLQRAKDRKMIDDLVYLIEHHQRNDKEDEEKEEEKEKSIVDKSLPNGVHYITKYGNSLFAFFCNSENTSWISIQQYRTLPQQLKNALCMDINNKFSIISLLQLFGSIKKISFTELLYKQITDEAQSFMLSIYEVIKYNNNTNHKPIGVYLQQVTFTTKNQSEGKENSTLKKLVHKYVHSFNRSGWNMEYYFEMETTHKLSFNKMENKVEISV